MVQNYAGAKSEPWRTASTKTDFALVGAELKLGEAGVQAALGHQGLVRALLHHPAVLHHYDPVGPQHSGQTVGMTMVVRPCMA